MGGSFILPWSYVTAFSVDTSLRPEFKDLLAIDKVEEQMDLKSATADRFDVHVAVCPSQP